VGLVAGLLLATWSGCKAGTVEPGMDMGGDTDGGPKMDALFEAPLRPTCTGDPGRICNGLDVHRCTSDEVFDEIVETCETACSLGRCTTPACAEAERDDGARGCLFYSAQVDNIDEADSSLMMLLVTNVSDSSANVAVQTRSIFQNRWEDVKPDQVASGGGSRLEVNRPIQEKGQTPSAAFRIVSDVPISVAQIVNEDRNHDSISTGGTALLPYQTLRHRYLAVTYPAADSADVAARPGSRGGAGMIAIVATEPGSVVTVTPTAAMEIEGSTVEKGVPYSLGLNDGDVLQVFSHDPGGDLTGTLIQGTCPLAVFSGNVFTSYGQEPSGWNGADLAIEQLPPEESWGQEYVGAWHAPQLACDSFWTSGAGMWQVVSATDGALVTLDPSPGTVFTSVDGDPFVGQTFKLDRGKSRRFKAAPALKSPGIVPAPTDFVARTISGHRILLAQWMDCEPSLSFGIDTRFGPDATALELPPGFDQEVLVVRRFGLPMALDGKGMREADFGPPFGSDLPLGTGTFQVARLTTLGVQSKPPRPCAEPEDNCQHVISGMKGFGISWRGMDIACSYALTFPPRDVCLLSGGHCGASE